ncbi:MAG: hypothetical protein V7707_20145 [Motiliproteus sp.]
MLNQTDLVEDTILLMTTCEVTSASGQPLDPNEEALDYQWFAFDPSADTMPTDAELIVTFKGSNWFGTRLH